MIVIKVSKNEKEALKFSAVVAGAMIGFALLGAFGAA